MSQIENGGCVDDEQPGSIDPKNHAFTSIADFTAAA